MNLKKKIFCALDFSEIERTIEFSNLIKDHIGGLKVGLEFFTKYGVKGVEKLKKIDLPIFLDLKFHDIPNTVTNAVKNVLELEPNFLTVHITGGQEMLEKVVKIKGKTKIIGVSLLTSLIGRDLRDFGLEISEIEFINKLTKIGLKSGIDGIVSSPNEVKFLKNNYDNKLIFVTPGIRMPENNMDDQKRLATPGEAIKSGSSILIIGRTITQSTSPLESISKIMQNIEKSLES